MLTIRKNVVDREIHPLFITRTGSIALKDRRRINRRFWDIPLFRAEDVIRPDVLEYNGLICSSFESVLTISCSLSPFLQIFASFLIDRISLPPPKRPFLTCPMAKLILLHGCWLQTAPPKVVSGAQGGFVLNEKWNRENWRKKREMNIENKIRANEIVRFGCSINSSGKKEAGITLTMMDGRLKIQNPGYEYPVLTGKVLRVGSKNKNDGQSELLPVVPPFPIRSSVFSSPEMQHLYISPLHSSTENCNRFQTSIRYFLVLYLTWFPFLFFSLIESIFSTNAKKKRKEKLE